MRRPARVSSQRLFDAGLAALYGLAMVFIVAPLLIIVAVSFTPERFLTFPPRGFALEWYVTFFTDSEWMGAFLTSLSIAAGTAVVSTSLGGTLAFALDRFDYRLGGLLAGVGTLPILLPPVIIGVAFLVFFLQVGLAGGATAIVIAHGIFYAPFPFVLVSQGLDEIDTVYEEASMNLGAAPLVTLRTVTFPLLRANIFSGAIFAFILSLNEYIIAWLLSLFLVNTIPIQIFTSLRYSYSPVIAAASVVFIALTFVVMGVVEYLTGGIWE